KGATGALLTVNGTLNAQGTTQSPITFTKDTNATWWGGIKLNSGGGASVIDHAEVSYGGWRSGGAGSASNAVSASIPNSTVRNSRYWGISLTGGAAPEVANDTITDNGGTGVSYNASSGTGQVKIHDNDVERNSGTGIAVGTSGSSVTGTTLSHNTVKSNSGT